MSKIADQSAQALLACKNFARGNTTVTTFLNDNGTKGAMMLLHGNVIATTMAYDTGIQVTITTAEHPARTTISRLNGIPGVQVKTARGQLFLNGQKWDGTWSHI